MSQPDKMRRNLMLGLGVGATAAAVGLVGMDELIAIADRYKPRKDTVARDGKTLKAAQLDTLRSVCDHVIPTTDTPGAVDVDVHGFIDHQLFECHTEGQRDAVRAVLDRLAVSAGSNQTFANLKPGEQLELLQALEATEKSFTDEDRDHFKFMKSLIVFGYFTSEVGASKALRFLPYPGGFRGSIAVGPNDKAWFK